VTEPKAPVSWIRPAVRALTPYHLDRKDVRVKLDQNENGLGVPETMRKELIEALSLAPLHRYPAPSQAEILATIAEMADWPEEGILVGNGSDDLLHCFAQCFLEPGRKAVSPTPSFFAYAYATRLVGAEVIEVRLPGMRYDVSAFLEAIERHQPVVVYLCSPNNPTGSTLDWPEIEAIAERTPGVVALDEAYWEFAGENGRPLLDRHPNLVLFRTFSKALALAGLRLGYLLAAPELAAEMRKAQQPYPVNRVSIEAARVAAKNGALLLERAREIARERDRLYERMSAVAGVEVFPSKGNFLLFRTRLGAKRTFASLLERGVLVRDVSGHPELSEMLRVAVGTPEENEAFYRALNLTLQEGL
jgi:histidinol-phosphate aminotransferase